jgi:LysR family transcriptional activator of mexEF-oprN operon
MEIEAAALRNVDLNLLLAFVVLMRERNVSRAARRLFIGQPGMSGALRRLRELLGDELLVPVGRRLEPTPRALQLLGPVEDALGSLQQVLLGPRAFEPSAAEGKVTIGLPDGHELTFLGTIARRLAQEAPRLRLSARAADRFTAGAQLDSGEIDVALCASPEVVARWHEAEHLFTQRYACLYSPRRIRLRGALGVDTYCRHPHVLVSYRGDFSGAVDEALARVGRAREVTIVVPRFSTVPFLLEEVAAFATMPELVARPLAQRFGLALKPPPVPVTESAVSMVWRRKDRDDPRQRWLRALILGAVQATLAQTKLRRA